MLTSIYREVSIGVLIIIVSILLIHTYRINVTVLPAITIYTLLLTAGIVSKQILRRKLSTLYNWRLFDIVAPSLFTVPLILVFHMGYQYAYIDPRSLGELVFSMLLGVGAFFTTLGLLRVL